MSSIVSSIFSRTSISNKQLFNNDTDLNELLSTPATNNSPVLASAFNQCYQKALLSLNQHIEEIDTQTLASLKTNFSSYNVTEDDFDTTVFPDRSLTPTFLALCQSRHEQFLNEKFIRLLIPIVAENMRSIVLRWIILELQNEEERGSRNTQQKNNLRDKLFELKSIEKSIDIDINRLYELSDSSKDVLIDQVDWKLVGTKLRSEGGFKYFDEYSLKRFWKHRCQYGSDVSWSNEEDDLLDELVIEFGYGNWINVAQHEIFQKNKKSAFMCAQRYMSKTNQKYAKRCFTAAEKNFLRSNYQQRCLVLKDYRFCVSYAAYLLGDRAIRDLTHIWTRINPDIEKTKFKPEEDALLLEHVKQSPNFSWTALATYYLPNRSAAQCRIRYLRLMSFQSESAESTPPSQLTQTTIMTKKSTKKKGSSGAITFKQWLEKQPVDTRRFIAQFYSKTRFTHLQKSIIEMHSNKIELLMKKFDENQKITAKNISLRELTLKLKTSTVTMDEIYASFFHKL